MAMLGVNPFFVHWHMTGIRTYVLWMESGQDGRASGFLNTLRIAARCYSLHYTKLDIKMNEATTLMMTHACCS